MNFEYIISQENLSCTNEDFETYFNTLDDEDITIVVTKNTFDVKYNNITIENIANGKYYYILEIEGMTFLQNIEPYVQGLVGLNDDNIDNIINNHKEQLKTQFNNNKKLQKTIEYFKSI